MVCWRALTRRTSATIAFLRARTWSSSVVSVVRGAGPANGDTVLSLAARRAYKLLLISEYDMVRVIELTKYITHGLVDGIPR